MIGFNATTLYCGSKYMISFYDFAVDMLTLN